VEAFGLRPDARRIPGMGNDIVVLQGVVSRKKQLIPAFIEAINKE
jgi:hypothetical protein